jgi:hypothetical protein
MNYVMNMKTIDEKYNELFSPVSGTNYKQFKEAIGFVVVEQWNFENMDYERNLYVGKVDNKPFFVQTTYSWSHENIVDYGFLNL